MTKDDENHRASLLIDEEIPPAGEMRKFVIGPFGTKEVPRLEKRYSNVFPPKSLICNVMRLDEDGGYKLVYLFQNYSNRPVKVTLRRLA